MTYNPRYHDTVYLLSPSIQKLLRILNERYQGDLVIKPFTTNRQLSIFRVGDTEPLIFLSYELLEDCSEDVIFAYIERYL